MGDDAARADLRFVVGVVVLAGGTMVMAPRTAEPASVSSTSLKLLDKVAVVTLVFIALTVFPLGHLLGLLGNPGPVL